MKFSVSVYLVGIAAFIVAPVTHSPFVISLLLLDLFHLGGPNINSGSLFNHWLNIEYLPLCFTLLIS